jgi:integrase
MPPSSQNSGDGKLPRLAAGRFRKSAQSFSELSDPKAARHIRSLEGDLKLFEAFIGASRPIASIMTPEIQRFIDSRGVGERRKFNLRAAIVSLFRWAERMTYVAGPKTNAEKVEKIERAPGQINVLSPDQMRTLLDNVRKEFLPWLAIGAFAGIRSEEIAPDRKSKKSPLRWDDFDWKRRVVMVRAETAKTKEAREVPILANLAEWLAPWRSAAGAICTREPSRSETSRLGKFIGGWKHNALRDSFCSYRASITQNIPQVSYEMGNSIAMVKRSYHRRQPDPSSTRMVQHPADQIRERAGLPEKSAKIGTSKEQKRSPQGSSLPMSAILPR